MKKKSTAAGKKAGSRAKSAAYKKCQAKIDVEKMKQGCVAKKCAGKRRRERRRCRNFVCSDNNMKKFAK